MRRDEAFIGQTVVTPDGHDCQVIEILKHRVKVAMPDGTTQFWEARKLKRTIETI